MPLPTMTVEIAFDSTPLDETPTWTDVSADVRHASPVRIERGRSSELENFNAGKASVTLSNRDRKYDPSNALGTHYGKLTPGRQIRITATYSATDYVMFKGFVTGWPQSFASGGVDATVTVNCVDGLGWFAKVRMPNDAVYDFAEGLSDLVRFLRRNDDYFWLDETGTTGGADLVYGARSTGSSLGAGMASPSISFSGPTLWRLATAVTDSSGWALSFWMQNSQVITADEIAVMGSIISNGLSWDGLRIVLIPGGQIKYEGQDGAGTQSLISSYAVNDGRPHHIMFTGSGSTLSLYIDGVEDTAAIDFGVTGVGYLKLALEYIGNSTSATALQSTHYQGLLQDVAVWSAVKSSGNAEFLYKRSNGFYPESIFDRVARVLVDAGWPTGWQNISTDVVAQCGRMIYNGRRCLEVLQELERTEQGRVFVAKDGDLTFLERYYYQTGAGATSQATFSDDGAGIEYSSFGFEYEDRDIQNDITVLCEPLGRGRAVDLTSVGEVGAKAASIDTVLQTSQSAAEMASGLVFQRKDPVWRSQPIVVPGGGHEHWATLLGLELCDRITAEITPMGTGSQFVQDLSLESIAWTVDAESWAFTAIGAPLGEDFFLLDSSSLDGPDALGY